MSAGRSVGGVDDVGVVIGDAGRKKEEVQCGRIELCSGNDDKVKLLRLRCRGRGRAGLWIVLSCHNI